MSKVALHRLGNLLNFKRGYDLPAYCRVEGEVPVISSGGVSGFHHEHKADGEGLVTGRYGTLGEVYYVSGKYWPHNTALYVTDFKGNCVRYLYYLLKLLGHTKTSDKSAVPGINRNDLHEVVVPAIKDTDEQKKIGKVLSSLDAKIELNQRINAELEGLAKLLYDYWFVQFDFPMTAAQAAALGKPHLTGQPYRASGGKMTYNETLKREIPEGWELTTIGAFSDNFDSKRIPLSKAEREKRPGTIPYYGATEVMDHIDDFIFEGDYVLLAEDGSVMDDAGFPVTQFIYGKTWVNNHAHVLRAKNPDNNEFLLHSIKRIPVINIMTGSIQKKITQDNLNAVPLANPTGDCLKAFSKVANNLRNQRINLEQQNQELTQLRDWLLPMLMNGQVTVG